MGAMGTTTTEGGQRIARGGQNETNKRGREEGEATATGHGGDRGNSGGDINGMLPAEVVHGILTEHLDRDYEAVVAERVCVMWAGLLAEARRGRRRTPEWRVRFMQRAAREGRLEVVKWARANGCPWDGWTCAGAASRGHLEVVEWARENGCPWDSATCLNAAYNGHLEVLEWARANGCPWDKNACLWAAWGGHLEVLEWAVANGCPWDPMMCVHAARDGHLMALRWAPADGRASDAEDRTTRRRRRKADHTAVIGWIEAYQARRAHER